MAYNGLKIKIFGRSTYVLLVIIIENGHGEPSSNLGQSCFHFIKC